MFKLLLLPPIEMGGCGDAALLDTGDSTDLRIIAGGLLGVEVEEERLSSFALGLGI